MKQTAVDLSPFGQDDRGDPGWMVRKYVAEITMERQEVQLEPKPIINMKGPEIGV